MIERNQIFINGAWVDTAGQAVIRVISPATEECIATVPAGAPEDVDRAVTAASRAFSQWSVSSVDERKAFVTKLARLMKARADEITQTIVSEVGEPITAARESQTGRAVKDLEVIAESLTQITWTEHVDSAMVRRVPAGVVGAITAWNAPMRLICMKVGAAMAAGCTVVLKGTEVAPQSSFIFAELAAEAGVPDGVLNVVSGNGPEIGEALVTHPLVDMVSLTGSVGAGTRVMALASASIKRVALELGGKSANVVLEDADLDRAVSGGVEDAFRRNGQVCGALSRLLVPRAQLRDAEERAVATAQSYVIGDPFDPATTLGPVTTARQHDRVRSYIRAGMADGARLLTGGPEAPDGLGRGYFVKPTVFSGDNKMRLAREEIFGPVVVIIPFDDEADAISIANDSPYGLAGGVWSADPDHARLVASRLRVGRVRINGTPLSPYAPHGGFKLSGVGREWGRYGIEEYLDYQSLLG